MHPKLVIHRIAATLAIDTRIVRNVMAGLSKTIRRALGEDGKVVIPGLGRFETIHAATDRQTGQKDRRHQSTTQAKALFSPSKEFLRALGITSIREAASQRPEQEAVDHVAIIAFITKVSPQLVRRIVDDELVALIKSTLAVDGNVPIAGLGTFNIYKATSGKASRLFSPSMKLREAVDPYAVNVLKMIEMAEQGKQPFAQHLTKIEERAQRESVQPQPEPRAKWKTLLQGAVQSLKAILSYKYAGKAMAQIPNK